MSKDRIPEGALARLLQCKECTAPDRCLVYQPCAKGYGPNGPPMMSFGDRGLFDRPLALAVQRLRERVYCSCCANSGCGCEGHDLAVEPADSVRE